ncbi:MAG: alpha/beta fold hydrolase [Betaproteobacteria bacterium]
MRSRMLGILAICVALAASGCAWNGWAGVNDAAYRDIRTAHWVWWGADPDKLSQALGRVQASKEPRALTGYWDLQAVYGPGHWAFEFNQLGEAAQAQAERFERASERSAASRSYHEASVYFGLAKYPYIVRDAVEKTAFERQRATYLKSWQLAGYEVAMIETQWKGQAVRGLLHSPRRTQAAKGQVPLVLATNGIDVFSTEFGPFARDLVDRGVAFFAFDIPGTGLNTEIKLEPDFDQLHLVFLETLLSTGQFNRGRVGLVGISFGGNAVVKLAVEQPAKFSAALNICGPVHDVFMTSVSRISYVERMYRDALADRWKLKRADPITLAENARGFSLVEQGVLAPTTQSPVPILNLNAAGDYVATESDMQRAARASKRGIVVFSGEGDHCPQDRPADMPRAAAWLASELTP